MALTGKMMCRGLEVTNAYVRANQVMVDNVNKTASASVVMYASLDYDPLPLDVIRDFYNVPIVNENPVQSIYDYMKTLDEYKHMKDC
jgi:hypothetical protein